MTKRDRVMWRAIGRGLWDRANDLLMLLTLAAVIIVLAFL